MNSIARSVALLTLFIAIVAASIAATPPTLDIYVVDVEGGNAVLVVSPSGESLLMDTGNLGGAARDAQRIMRAVKDAGLRQIDHLVTTHWHLDHFGGMEQLAGSIPIRAFIDHGRNVQPGPEVDRFLHHTYPSLYASARHSVAKAGDTIPMKDVEVRVVASAGETIKQALPDAGTPNPYCVGFTPEGADRGENGQSIGLHITFGRFRVLHLGDLSADKEFDLMCPENRIGKVDLFMVSHHGQSRSNTPVLVHAIASRAAIMNNSLRKGGEPDVMKVIHSAPGLENLWQLHFSERSGPEYNVPGMFIANTTEEPIHDGSAYWIKVSAQPNGTFTITNARNAFSKTYRARDEVE